jgi:MATE family multidrug resistance protein
MLLVALASFGFAPSGIAHEVATPAAGYLRILNWGTLPLLLYGGTRRYLQAVGDVKVITVTYIAANLLNWFGNWLLIGAFPPWASTARRSPPFSPAS